MSNSGTVLARAAAHLNDVNQLEYTSTVLLPFLNMAIDELEEEMAVFELSPMVRDSILILVPAGSTELPQIPVDFVEAINLTERAQGSQADWGLVGETFIVNRNLANNPSDSIIQWSARDKEIFINPPGSDREVILDYIGGFTEATGTGTVLDIEKSRRFLALVTARNAARDLGNSTSKAGTYESDISRARDRLVRKLQKDSQGILGARRLPYLGRGI